MKLTDYKYQNGDSFPHAIAEGYKEAEKYWGIPGAASGAGQYAMHNKGKTFAVFGVILAASLTAAYFLIPAYATFVGASVAKVATLVSPVITVMSALAVAHPLIASLVALAAAAALIAAPIYGCLNSSKASQIGKIGELLNGSEEPGTKLDKIEQILGIQKEKEAAKS